MPIQRKPVPKDSPMVIAVRERMKPVDTQTIVAKNGKGELVICTGEGQVPFTGTPDLKAKLDKELKAGGADQFAFRSINSHKRRMGTATGQGWTPVKRSEKLAAMPYGYGDETSALICNADTILHKRPLEMHVANREQQRLYSRMQLASAEEQLKIAAESTAGVKDYVHNEVEGDPSEGLTLSQPGV